MKPFLTLIIVFDFIFELFKLFLLSKTLKVFRLDFILYLQVFLFHNLFLPLILLTFF